MSRKAILLSVITISITALSLNAQQIKFFSTINKTLSKNEPIKYGFEYKTKSSTRKTGSYFGYTISKKKYDKLNFKVYGLPHTGTTKQFDFDRNKFLKNKGKIYLSYNHPKFPEVTHYDTISLPFPEQVELLVDKLDQSNGNPLSIKSFFNDGKERIYSGSEAYSFLKTYGMTLNGIHVDFELINSKSEGYISNKIPLKSFSSIDQVLIQSSDEITINSLKNLSIEIRTFDNNSTRKKMRLSYRDAFKFDVSGNSGQKSYSHGNHGKNGKNVSVLVEHVNNNLYNVKVTTNSGKGKNFILNPTESIFTVFTKGGNGTNGRKGERGNHATNYDQAVSSENNRNLGERGENGYAGGDGGNGGDVTIYYPESFKPYLSIFKIYNNGGSAGNGGSGGNGGRHQLLRNQQGKILNALFPDCAEDGRNGADGRNGTEGRTLFILQ